MFTPVLRGRWLSPGSEAVAELEENPWPPLGGEMWAEKVGWWSAHRDVSSGEWPGEGLARHDLILAEGLAYFAHPRRAKGHAQTLNLRATWPSTTHHTPLGGAKWSVSPFPETWKILCVPRWSTWLPRSWEPSKSREEEVPLLRSLRLVSVEYLKVCGH